MRDIWEAVKAKGIQHDNHSTDLYIPVNAETRALVAEYEFKCNVTTFICQIDGKLWYDIPFAYEPEWERRLGHPKVGG